MALLTNEQKAELVSDFTALNDMYDHAFLQLNVFGEAPQLILNDLHEIQDRVSRMVAKLEDIING